MLTASQHGTAQHSTAAILLAPGRAVTLLVDSMVLEMQVGCMVLREAGVAAHFTKGCQLRHLCWGSLGTADVLRLSFSSELFSPLQKKNV